MTIYIFECNESTVGECFEKKLFGTHEAWPLGRVKAGDVCFLFQYGTSQQIYGVFTAIQNARSNIVPRAWRGRFPNQVRVQQTSRDLISVPKWKLNDIVTDPATARVAHWLTGPKAQDLLDFFGHAYASPQVAGAETDAFENDFRERYPKEFRTTSGVMVRSRGEWMIAETLSQLRVYSEYERISNLPEGLTPDFSVYRPDGRPVFIEFWGLLNNPDYQLRRLRKCRVYHRHQCALIELYDDDLRNLEFRLREELLRHGVPISAPPISAAPVAPSQRF